MAVAHPLVLQIPVKTKLFNILAAQPTGELTLLLAFRELLKKGV